MTGETVIGCGGGSSCDLVLNSRWSSIGGVIPVSGLAAGAYLAMLAAIFSIGSDSPPAVRRLAWRAMLVIAGAILGSALWFFILQKWIIHSFCPYCMITHITGVILATLVFWQAPRQLKDATDAPASAEEISCRPGALTRRACDGRSGARDSATVLQNSPPRYFDFRAALQASRPAIAPACIGLALAATMAFCQTRFTPPPIYRSGSSQQAPPAIDPHAVPLVGSPDAPYVVSLLFDYKCPHCQQLHFMLNEAIRQYHGKLAFALCPTPLNTNCNQFVPRNVDEFKDSCELAKVALAVWVADRKAYPAFDLWMFTLDSGDRWRPRTLEAARAKAIALVGQSKFESALSDPWVNQYLQTSVRIYGQTLQGGNVVPKLVFGTRWVVPQPDDPAALVSLIHSNLAIPTP